MRTVAEMPYNSRGRRSKYDQFMDGQTWLIEPGDFPTVKSLEVLRSMIVGHAQRRGLLAQTTIKPEGLYVTAVPRP
jgi:hypothetical protein